jgi:hypothetical protein
MNELNVMSDGLKAYWPLTEAEAAEKGTTKNARLETKVEGYPTGTGLLKLATEEQYNHWLGQAGESTSHAITSETVPVVIDCHNGLRHWFIKNTGANVLRYQINELPVLFDKDNGPELAAATEITDTDIDIENLIIIRQLAFLKKDGEGDTTVTVKGVY